MPEFGWTAVKITGHDYENACAVVSRFADAGGAIREETCAGQQTDTARYLAAGARRALLVMRTAEEVPIAEIRRALGADRNVIFESNRIVDLIKADVVLGLVKDSSEVKPSFRRFLAVADAVVSL